MKRSDIRNFFRALHEGKGFDPIYEGKKGLYCGSCNTMNEKEVSECDTCGCSSKNMQEVEFEETAEGRKIINAEELKGKQYKLDKDKDGKITKKDFDILNRPKKKKKK